MGIDILQEINSKKILFCFVHPDDELYVCGNLIQHLVENKEDITFLCLTSGQAGKNHSASIDELANIRKKELRYGLKYLGVDENKIIIANFEDSKIRNDSLAVEKYMNEFIISNKFDCIFTFDNTGITGHPDHITISKILFGIATKYEIPMFVPTLAGIARLFHINSGKNKYLNLPTHFVSNNFETRLKKYKALLIHSSQFNTVFYRIFLLWILFSRKELFHKMSKNTVYNYEYTNFKI